MITGSGNRSNWKSTGLAYQATQSPANSNSNWLRYTDGTVNQWHNMERVGVYQENGHVTHFTFAVTDVDKNSSAVNSGGSKILVVPFNGVQFDCDNGDAASCAEAASGAGGAGGIGGGGGQGGSGGAAGAAATGGGAVGAGGGTAGGAAGSTGGKSGGAGVAPGTGGRTTGTVGAAGQSGSTAGSSSGCACDVAPARPMRATLLWLATLLAFLRRRRCRHQ